MNFLLDFFENYNGAVYATELESNRLVYMNACLRRYLGLADDGAYKGRLCHEVLQGRAEPCEFCTNQKIQEGEFYSWIYRNPVMKKDFVLNDTLICCDGQKYRLEIAMDRTDQDSETVFYARSEQILIELLRQVFSTADENQAIDTLLKCIGETFACERVYICELTDQNKKVDNTYEWCADGVLPQKALLQNVPYESVSFWFDMFDREGMLSIADLEDIRESYPLTYAYLRPQGIHSLMVGPIQGDEEYIGFVGADNPKKENIATLSHLMRVIGHFVSILLKRRDWITKLRKQSHHDPLTGALNRNALADFFVGEMDMNSLGIVYCDISGLKQVNDLYGHAAGDDLILQGYRLISSAMKDGNTYRIGGDEFVVTCVDLTRQDFMQRVEALRRQVASARYHIAVGNTWTDSFPASFDELLRSADQEMYRDKQQYYRSCHGEDRRKHDRRRAQDAEEQTFRAGLGRLLPGLTAHKRGNYTCVGDYQSRCYYISDDMKEKFDFSSNVVYDFMTQWEERIIGEEQKRLFRQNIAKMLEEKRTYANFCYAMQDRDKRVVMARCSGLIQWDETHTEPLTLLGSVQIEQNEVRIDPITSFPMMQSAVEALGSLQESATVLLFKFNRFDKVNEAAGKPVGNRLLHDISAGLRAHFGETAAFYRLEGLKFMGIFSGSDRPHPELVETIRDIAAQQYAACGVLTAEPLTFIPIAYSNQKESPLELLQNVAAMMSATEFNPVSQAITNSTVYLNEVKQQLNMESALVGDIQNQMSNFRIVIQPMVASDSGDIAGGEVLLRWTFQEQDILPEVFIPIIERENLMGIVGKWVLEQTVQCSRNIAVYRPQMYLTFNVSYQQLLFYNFANTIKTVLRKYGIQGERIIAELAGAPEEDAADRLQAFMDACAQIGVRTALDDWGDGGFSTMFLLKSAAGLIKLHRSVLSDLLQSEEKAQFVCRMVESCHKLGKQVCMEGVENEAELAAAEQVGCDLIQGFYFYKPLELYDLYQELTQTLPNQEACVSG